MAPVIPVNRVFFDECRDKGSVPLTKVSIAGHSGSLLVSDDALQLSHVAGVTFQDHLVGGSSVGCS